MEPDPTAVAATTSIDAVGTRERGAYLLVIEDGSSTIVELPEPGILTIGRGPDAELRLEHSSISRSHARIVVGDGEARISDLDSHNGTRVNGQLITAARVLATGDVIAIGEVIAVAHVQLRQASRALLDEATWRRRLTEEVERAVAFRRSLAVLAITGGEHAAIAGRLRTIDLVGRDGDGLVALLPEADPPRAAALAEAVASAAPGVRIGIAACPSDAIDADHLVLAARAAVRGATRIGRVADAIVRRRFGDRDVLLCHPAMVRLYDLLERLAASDLPVLLLGETGVGKEDAAHAVHACSARREGPFVAVNCGGLAESVVESELFGHAKGAFTGATSARAGVFEAATAGTLFLDEIGELPLGVQAKLLRVLETKRITRIGETHDRAVDVRIVAATNRVLGDEVDAGQFRRDLYFRIGGARAHLLPLRDRPCDIPILFREFVARAAHRAGRQPPVATPDVMRHLLAYRWPGNVRELRHVAELAVAIVEDDRIEASDLPAELGVELPPAPPARDAQRSPRRLADEIADLERRRMIEALAQTGRIKTRAAALLGMPIRTFNLKFRQYGL